MGQQYQHRELNEKNIAIYNLKQKENLISALI